MVPIGSLILKTLLTTYMMYCARRELSFGECLIYPWVVVIKTPRAARSHTE